jgi:ABC-type multidrug transport system ATPase subunit
MNARVEARGVSVRDRLVDVSVAVAPGEVHALVGPNGSGKSTLLAVLAGDLLPDTGTVLLEGESWS